MFKRWARASRAPYAQGDARGTFPKSKIIAILRGTVMMPLGCTIVQPGDRLLIVVSPQVRSGLEIHPAFPAVESSQSQSQRNIVDQREQSTNETGHESI
jgi:hypothetical protein